MDDPNMTMEEYIKLEEEKARRRGRVFNWQTATYGKIRVDDDLHDLRSVEAEFPAIVINDAFARQDALQCKSQVSTPVNDEIDFRISFDESDDEDYTIIYDKNSFSYKMISVNNLKTDSENDNEKAGVPSFPPPKPTTSYIDDLDFFNDFENEFPAIVYNDAQTSKSDLLTEPILSPQHIDEFNLNDETSVSEYDEEEQNILYYNDIFPFNIIHPDDLKTEKDNNDNDIDIIQSSEGNEITHRSNMLMDLSSDKIDKIFDKESFFLELNVNIVTWIYLFNGMLLCFIMNLYVPFGIPFDLKRYYKDDDCAIMLRRPSVSVMPLLTYLNLGLGELAHTRLTVELADRTVKYPKGIAKNVHVGIGKFTFLVDFIILDMPKDIKVPLILGRPFLSTARAKINVYKRKITLRVGEERIVFSSVKPASSLIKRVYMLSLRERMELDLEARHMGETLVLNRSLDPFLEDYTELNDINEPFKLRRNQGDDLMPTIEEGEVIKEFKTRDDELDTEIDDYPSYCHSNKKIHIDCAYNLKFSCMIGFEFTHVSFFPLLYVNIMSKKFHNSIMKDKMVYKGDNVVGALMNVPIFVGIFSFMTDFAVLEDMDAYRDKGMGDVIVGEPFLRDVRIKTKWLEGIITLYKIDDEITYQMVRSHPRFKRRTNAQCNKIPPLLKVSEKDEKNGISHAYQKLKGFYKGVLNLGPDYIRDAKIEEWLTRRHISMHKME
ncbi:homeodomain-like protein [Tanacetum coccineum]